MAENTKIEWAHHTFNPWYGCQKVGPGCDHCYAEAWSKRSGLVQWGPGVERRRSSAANWQKPLKWNAEAERLGIRYRVFCASLADVFDNEIPTEWRMDLFLLIAKTPHLDWLLVTKRIGNVNAMSTGDGLMFDMIAQRVWLGATICNQVEADRDIPKLLQIPAKIHWLSMEPLLGAIDIERYLLSSFDKAAHNAQMLGTECRADKLDWIVVGGESGSKARPMHPNWTRSLRDQCAEAGVPFMFKQWGEYCGGTDRLAVVQKWVMIDETGRTLREAGSTANMGPITHVARFGKKVSGRLLDGIQHDEYPGAAH